ncbi:MAG: beta-ketoacyl-ACP synthase [Gammaproteobacteria bacterium]|nr:beta-ketoacyl-ACP synthase [Gammaproteobacteria bacterium]
MNRVVITGTGAVTALGSDWPTVLAGLQARRNAVVRVSEWDSIEGLRCRLASPVADFKLPEHYSRRQRRGMGRVAALAVRSAELALEQAGLLDDPVLGGGRTGVAFGSATGSPDALLEFVGTLVDNTTAGLNATSYVRMMSHTAAVNIGIFFGLKGRVLTTSSACTAGSQGIGYAFETIRCGAQDVMLAGGAEELSPTEVAVFDTLLATSTRNDEPAATPRPFDRDRDGLVIGEGAATLVLESLEHAVARGAPILGEVVGYGTNMDGSHVTNPDQDSQARCLELALASAGLAADAISYVSAHGTATAAGDVSESHATRRVLGPVPISSLKSYLGHTLGACGAQEAWAALMMLREGWFAPTLNLEHVDPACAELDYVTGDGRHLDGEYVMSNNFAFGGINTSLILRRGEAG